MSKREKTPRKSEKRTPDAPIVKATRAYEKWLSAYTVLVAEDLKYKHEQMALSTFPFLRATFYRWIELWPTICPELLSVSTVLAVGDLHIENFGTWRDKEGRLVWGVNDFDEACYLPFTQDLVRLAASVHLAVEENRLRFDGDKACQSILRGYADSLKANGKPFVLEEAQSWLRDIAMTNLRDPVRFWQKMEGLPEIAKSDVPESAVVAIEHMLPQEGLTFPIKRRVAGLGSLGHPRFVALLDYNGGKLAREAKALVPSSIGWANEYRSRVESGDTAAVAASAPVEIYYQAIVDRAVRCADPMIALQGHWIVRRLSPSCARIELTALSSEQDEENLLYAMGWETANIHLGSSGATGAAKRLKDLDRLRKRDTTWLSSASRKMVEALRTDWQAWESAHNAAK